MALRLMHQEEALPSSLQRRLKGLGLFSLEEKTTKVVGYLQNHLSLLSTLSYATLCWGGFAHDVLSQGS